MSQLSAQPILFLFSMDPKSEPHKRYRNNLPTHQVVPQPALKTFVCCPFFLTARPFRKIFFTQFNFFASPFDWWNHLPGAFCPQFFPAGLTGDALSFSWSLNRTQKTHMNPLVMAFQRQYASSHELLKTKVIDLRQRPGKIIPVLFPEFRGLALLPILSRLFAGKSSLPVPMPSCPTLWFGNRFEKPNMYMLTLHLRQQ